MKDKERQAYEKWTDGIAYEVAFWNNACRWTKTFMSTMRWSHLGSVICLEGFDANRFLLSQPAGKVLDVGCGMSFATGNFVGEGQVRKPLDIHYVDPLAHYFNAIAARHKRELPTIEFGMMEHLSAFFPNQDTALVIIQNALDHSSEPIKGVIEALQTVRIGGVVYLNHHPNEAETEHYKGFHQYNINEDNGHLIIWNQEGRSDVTDMLKPFTTMEVNRQLDTGHIIAVIHKTAAVPSQAKNDKTDIHSLCEKMMTSQRKAQSIGHAVKYKLKYWAFNTIQFFAQSLSYETKMKLKKLIRQDSQSHE